MNRRRLTSRAPARLAGAVLLAVLGVACARAQPTRTVFTCSGNFTLVAPEGYATYRWSPLDGLNGNTDGRSVRGRTSGNTRYTVSARNPRGDNLLVNPGFEDGDVGFSSDYRYSASANDAERTYGIVASAPRFHAEYADCRDARGGSSLVMAVDGATAPDLDVWCQEVPITAGGDYRFGFAHASLTDLDRESEARPARLGVYVNGTHVGTDAIAGDQSCDWRAHEVFLEGLRGGSVEICIREETQRAAGNDFALDDLTLYALGEPDRITFEVTVGSIASSVVEVPVCPGGRWRQHGYDIAEGGVAVVRLEAAGGCDSVVTYKIVGGGEAGDSAAVTTLCAGDTYTYRSAQLGAVPLTRDTSLYDVYRLANGCDSTYALTTRFLGPDAIEAEGRAPRCADAADGRLAVRATAGEPPFRYRWRDDGSESRERTNLPAGRYVVEVSDARGCTAEAAVDLAAPPPVSLAATEVEDEACPGDAGAVVPRAGGGTGRLRLELTDGDGAGVSAGALPPGDYLVTAVDSVGCRAERPVTVAAAAPFGVAIAGATLVRLAQPVRHRAVVEGEAVALAWTFGERVLGPDDLLSGDLADEFEWLPQGRGILTVTAVDANGCTATDAVGLGYQRRDSPFFPSAFSPNGDDVNDAFGPVVDSSLATLDEFGVYDRWGALIHRAVGCPVEPDSPCAWRGTYPDGRRAPSGVYVYRARLRLVDGSTLLQQGDILLVGEGGR